LAGGLAVLVLDLGRPDRLIISMTHYNFKSIFVWNINFYMGFFAVVAAYLWVTMDWRLTGLSKPVGILAFMWRLALTSCTGWVFGFIVARQGWDAAVMAPMFIVFSFASGLAIFLLVLLAAYSWTRRPLGDAVVKRLKNLLGVFVAASLYFTAVQHLANLYATEHHGVTRFILADGGIFTTMFWVGQVLIGGVIPMILVWYPGTKDSRQATGLACLLVVLGGLAQMFVTIVGGLAYPQVLFPGMEISSSFFDGVVGSYSPSAWEFLLGIGGIAIALLMATIAVKFLRFLPASLADEIADPHHRPAVEVAETPEAA
ncbi:MAG: polysulfide reductase NrfD, partial [Rhodospirillales bacterium]|nr:polysulfide reductase NrfD [Rhodospirillales bacterium]